jgi:hypothetical protein
VSAFAQIPAQTETPGRTHKPDSRFSRSSVTSRQASAGDQTTSTAGGATKLEFAGTATDACSKLVKPKWKATKGYIEHEVEFGNLAINPDFRGRVAWTYILGAISPEGRAVNLGEIFVGE